MTQNQKRPSGTIGGSLTGGRMYRMRANKQFGITSPEAALTNAFEGRTGQCEAAPFGYYAIGRAESSPIVFADASKRGVL